MFVFSLLTHSSTPINHSNLVKSFFFYKDVKSGHLDLVHVFKMPLYITLEGELKGNLQRHVRKDELCSS